MLKTGDCVIRHAGIYTTGMAMVVRFDFCFKIWIPKDPNRLTGSLIDEALKTEMVY